MVLGCWTAETKFMLYINFPHPLCNNCKCVFSCSGQGSCIGVDVGWGALFSGWSEVMTSRICRWGKKRQTFPMCFGRQGCNIERALSLVLNKANKRTTEDKHSENTLLFQRQNVEPKTNPRTTFCQDFLKFASTQTHTCKWRCRVLGP